MLMAWGPFRFTVPNYSVETIRRSLQPRAEAQPVINSIPPIHRLGPGNETITLQSTFHPRHLNGRGLAQLAGVRQAVNALTPLQLVHINGAGFNIFGLWLATAVESEETMLDHNGTPQMVTASLTMMSYDRNPARAAAVSAVLDIASLSAGGSLGGGSINVSLGLGF